MRGREQLSKRGNARLRLAFWMAGTIAVRLRENLFSDKYERYIRAAPGDADLKRKALTAVCAKMARVAYGLITESDASFLQRFETRNNAWAHKFLTCGPAAVDEKR